MLREWIRTFAEFPIASFLFGVFILIMTVLTALWMETFLMNIASIISSIKTVHIEHEQADDACEQQETSQ